MLKKLRFLVVAIFILILMVNVSSCKKVADDIRIRRIDVSPGAVYEQGQIMFYISMFNAKNKPIVLSSSGTGVVVQPDSQVTGDQNVSFEGWVLPFPIITPSQTTVKIGTASFIAKEIEGGEIDSGTIEFLIVRDETSGSATIKAKITHKDGRQYEQVLWKLPMVEK